MAGRVVAESVAARRGEVHPELCGVCSAEQVRLLALCQDAQTLTFHAFFCRRCGSRKPKRRVDFPNTWPEAAIPVLQWAKSLHIAEIPAVKAALPRPGGASTVYTTNAVLDVPHNSVLNLCCRVVHFAPCMGPLGTATGRHVLVVHPVDSPDTHVLVTWHDMPEAMRSRVRGAIGSSSTVLELRRVVAQLSMLSGIVQLQAKGSRAHVVGWAASAATAAAAAQHNERPAPIASPLSRYTQLASATGSGQLAASAVFAPALAAAGVHPLPSDTCTFCGAPGACGLVPHAFSLNDVRRAPIGSTVSLRCTVKFSAATCTAEDSSASPPLCVRVCGTCRKPMQRVSPSMTACANLEHHSAPVWRMNPLLAHLSDHAAGVASTVRAQLACNVCVDVVKECLLGPGQGDTMTDASREAVEEAASAIATTTWSMHAVVFRGSAEQFWLHSLTAFACADME